MSTFLIVLAGGIAGAIVYRFGYYVGRKIERNRWEERAMWERLRR